MKISIITINFNNLEGLKKTVNSVISQTYNNIEYIIIDGASTDGSAEYVKEQKQYFNYWVSEPDKGIYNAMNKGIDRATGDYLLFLNSGDYLVDENVIEKFVGFEPVEDIVYGDVMLEYNEIRRELKKTPERLTFASSLNYTITHQAIFHKKNIYDASNYDESYKIIADWVFYNNVIFRENKLYKKIDLLVTNYDMNGFSADTDISIDIYKERMRFFESFTSKELKDILNDFSMLYNDYNGLLSSGTVKMALKVSAILYKIKSVFNG